MMLSTAPQAALDERGEGAGAMADLVFFGRLHFAKGLDTAFWHEHRVIAKTALSAGRPDQVSGYFAAEKFLAFSQLVGGVAILALFWIKRPDADTAAGPGSSRARERRRSSVLTVRREGRPARSSCQPKKTMVGGWWVGATGLEPVTSAV